MREVSWRPSLRQHAAKIARLEPEAFRLETTTVWSFPARGRWATHTGSYPGNWAPEVPRNLILRYTQEGETVLDPMMGSGTTLLECLLMNRYGIGVDIEPEAVDLAASNLSLGYRPIDWAENRAPVRLFEGDARRLDAIPDGSVHLAALHPPYAGIITYGPTANPLNLSRLPLKDYLAAMGKVATEAYRVLAPNRHCAVLIGDTRRHKHYVPLAVRVLEQFLDAGFVLREDIIKPQNKMKRTLQSGAGIRTTSTWSPTSTCTSSGSRRRASLSGSTATASGGDEVLGCLSGIGVGFRHHALVWASESLGGICC